MRRRITLFTTFLAACSTAVPPPTQEPAPEPEAATAEAQPDVTAPEPAPTQQRMAMVMAAGAKVSAATSDVPTEIDLQRGDAVTFSALLRDAQGNPLPDALYFLMPGENFSVEPGPREFIGMVQGGESPPESFKIVGDGAGHEGLQVVVVSPEAFADGQPRALFKVPITVHDYPAARVEIDPLDYGAYVGSVFPLEGRVMTVRDTEHQTADIMWSSSDPSIASVTEDGIVAFNKAGNVRIIAESEGLGASIPVQVLANPVASISLEASNRHLRTGDVENLEIRLLDRNGRELNNVHIAYSVTPISGPENGAVVYEDGAFVAEQPGTYRVLTNAAGVSQSTVISATARNASREIELTGRAAVTHVTTSDLWVFEGRDGRDYAYTGTHSGGGGQRMFAWDVTDPSTPVLTDSVVVNARVVNDVKVNAERTLAVITREGASDRKEGIVILDVADPAHPVVLSEFKEGMTGGVHNTWIEGDYVYAVHNGTRAVHIVDISDPANPKHAGRWEIRPGERNKYVHDVWIDDGLAYISYWDDGLVILDIGAGIKGGTPTDPTFVSQYKYPGGNTHTAYRYGNYVFVGDEIFGCDECVNGPRGYIHVVDVREIENPKEVARFEVPEAGTHNIWVEDDLLYIAYYQAGLRVVDISGELRGDLYRQGRQVAWYQTSADEDEGFNVNSPMAWGPQLHKGNIFVSDWNSGLWIVRLAPPEQPLMP